ncbi:MAG: hypothetical protein NT141_00065 [candidate division WWE3 bacterium]|nr:hypothetical protein [candidate division WWE3 bacterium]
MVEIIYSEQVNKNLMDNYLPGLFEFCSKHNLVYFEPSKENNKKVLELVAKGFPQVEGNITCYIRTFGPQGMYHPEDNCISICPIDIDKAPGGFVGTIKHEITHLSHPEANSMDHEKKEDYINNQGFNL